MKRYLSTIFSSLLVVLMVGLVSTPASAQSLDSLRTSGAVGEGMDGFVHVRSGGTAAQAVADQVNAKRRSIYAQRAAEQGVSSSHVGGVYFKQIINKAPSGTWYQNQSGGWAQK